MENGQREAGEELPVLPRFGWNSSYWSKEMYQIFGFDPGPTPPSYLEIAQRLHPEDARYYTRVVEKAIRDRTNFEADYRLLLPNGAAKYIHVVGHPVVNAAGDVIELVGTAMDVTEQHEARVALETAFEEIKAEEIELRRMTDAIASHIYVLRPDGTALYANQTVLDYVGLTLEDVQKEDHRARVFHPEDVERLREERHAALARGEPFELEQRALGKTVIIAGFLSATILFATIRGTLFAGMRLQRILRIASRPRSGCVMKTLRSGSKSIRHSCLRKLWVRHRPCKPCSPAL
jgi:PAS domain S-box-containing protein